MQIKMSFSVPPYLLPKFAKMIREKLDVVLLQLDALYCIQSGIQESINGNLVIEMDVARRMYFFEENRFYSISFPFIIKKGDSEGDGYSFFCNDEEISSTILAYLQEIVTDLKKKGLSSMTYYDLIDAVENPVKDFDGNFDEKKACSLWNIVSYLLSSEDSYVRYDYDEKRVDVNHPLNHLDINYSAYGTYKIGLPDSKKEYGKDNKRYMSQSWFRELCNSNPIKRIENI